MPPIFTIHMNHFGSSRHDDNVSRFVEFQPNKPTIGLHKVAVLKPAKRIIHLNPAVKCERYKDTAIFA